MEKIDSETHARGCGVLSSCFLNIDSVLSGTRVYGKAGRNLLRQATKHNFPSILFKVLVMMVLRLTQP